MATTNSTSLNALQDRLQVAAADLTAAYALEVEQQTVTGIAPQPAATIPLNQLIQSLVNQGSLNALMDSALIQGNQSKAADLLGINRATLRKRLGEVGLLVQRRQLSAAELVNRQAREAA